MNANPCQAWADILIYKENKLVAIVRSNKLCACDARLSDRYTIKKKEQIHVPYDVYRICCEPCENINRVWYTNRTDEFNCVDVFTVYIWHGGDKYGRRKDAFLSFLDHFRDPTNSQLKFLLTTPRYQKYAHYLKKLYTFSVPHLLLAACWFPHEVIAI